MVFVYGASAGVGIAVLLHQAFDFGFQNSGGPLPISSALLGAVIIAPIVEEFAKGAGLGLIRRELDELEDGIIYGIAAGLGFAATENFVYGFAALASGGFQDAVLTIAIRIFSSMLLHASASGLIGFGYGVVTMRGGVALEVLPHYLAAVLLHAGFNLLVSIGAFWGFIAALVLVAGLFGVLRRRVRDLDELGFDPSALR